MNMSFLIIYMKNTSTLSAALLSSALALSPSADAQNVSGTGANKIVQSTSDATNELLNANISQRKIGQFIVQDFPKELQVLNMTKKDGVITVALSHSIIAEGKTVQQLIFRDSYRGFTDCQM